MRKILSPYIVNHPEKLHEEWHILRNQEIECRLAGHLGQKRPGYLERDPIAVQASFIKQQQESMQEDWEEIQKGADV